MDSQVFISSTSTDADYEPSPLLRLPEELLDEIIRLATGAQAYDTVQPLCRRLYPLQRRHYYRSIRISNYPMFAGFCATTAAVPALRDLVVQLGLELYEASNDASSPRLWGVGSGPHSWDDSHLADEDKVVTPADLSALLARLSRLEVLKLDYLSVSLLGVILYDEATLPSLRRLETLGIMTPSTEGPPGARPDAWVRQLARLPALETLAIAREVDGDLFPPFDAPMPSFTSVTTLVLGRHSHEWTGPALRDIMPNLVALDLSSASRKPDYQAILEGAPDGLRRLSMRGSLRPDSPSSAVSPPNLQTAGLRFKHLEHLALGGHLFTPDILHATPSKIPSLRSLTFAPGTPATDTLLSSLLSGRARLANLRVVTLDHLYAHRGPTIASRGGVLPSNLVLLRNPPMYDGWLAPNEVQGCSAAGVVAAVAAGRTHGVCVRGTALGVVGWEEQYAAERAAAIELWGEDGPRELEEAKKRALMRLRTLGQGYRDEAAAQSSSLGS
ncbi:uncharacterized protein RHOBADRAFT_56162 [Rhodotorula graminis WP1]|uniref:F-box domain-containing protein n=1 Tax=Rhodotorula graminis (strain WP1) TaxID=578459 RepID=A0A0P9GX66_RHOGW|nr:uncharacterized protein RHOBADRAFT_56162 [Rhodotorula graminis WP1]KPV72026.1 hypothetical protein RHOBADRAFT_56162 [Rhodotorula graminis WP1]